MSNGGLTDREKFLIFERDGFRCRRCSEEHNLHVGHKVPVERGGTNAARNLLTVCQQCNEDQGKLTWEEFTGETEGMSLLETGLAVVGSIALGAAVGAGIMGIIGLLSGCTCLKDCTDYSCEPMCSCPKHS